MPQDKPLNHDIFTYNLSVYGSDFSRWPDCHSDSVATYLENNPDLQPAYNEAKAIDEDLDFLSQDDLPVRDIKQATLEQISHITNEGRSQTASNDNRYLVAGYGLAVAALIAFFIAVPFMPMQPASEVQKIDIFLDEIYAMTDVSQLDPNIFFENGKSETFDEEIDEFLDNLFDGQKKQDEPGIWEMFSDENNQKT